MSWYLTDFGTVALPQRLPEDDAGAGTVDSTIVDSIAGAYDAYGTRPQLQRKAQITHRGTYLGEEGILVDDAGDFIVDGSDNIYLGDAVTDLMSQRDGIAAMLGRRDSLWRQSVATGTRQWRTARLVGMEATDTVDNAKSVITVQTTYETVMDGWRAASATTTSTTTVANTAKALVVSVAGDAPVYDAVLTVARNSGTITRVQVSNAEIDWTWTGSIGTGESLEVNAATQTVRESGISAYDGFVLNSTHEARSWLQLTPGETILLITTTGGGATVTLTHYNRYR